MDHITTALATLAAGELISWAVILLATAYSAGILGIYHRNRGWFKPLDPVHPGAAGSQASSASPSVPAVSNGEAQATRPAALRLLSVCIPARNEERAIGRLLDSLAEQTSPPHEILVLDDGSTDKTPDILRKYSARYPGTFKVLHGEPKPEGWLGKPWACHQLSEAAAGDVLVFLDADVRVDPRFCERIGNTAAAGMKGLITIWPLQELGSFWERAVIPLVYFTLLSLLPIPYQHRKPRWMPGPVYARFRGRFAAACGQCMIFDRGAYNLIGGHASVRLDVVEDVALARRIRSAGIPMRMTSGHGAVSCRMYRDEREMYAGFRKNFLAGFDDSIPLFLFMGLLHMIVYLGPIAVFVAAIVRMDPMLTLMSLLPILLLAIHRRDLDRWMGWNPNGCATHPLGVLWFQRLALRSLLDRLGRAPVEWKGRNVR